MHTAFLALGSNVGDRAAHIENAVQLLSRKVEIVARAPLYETRPEGITDQPDFLNTALECRTDMSVRELLAFAKEVEREEGRIERLRWGPREIDIDIIFYDDLVYQDETLTIPHPRMQDRDFVLRPLAALAPDHIHPVLHKTVQTLLGERGA